LRLGSLGREPRSDLLATLAVANRRRSQWESFLLAMRGWLGARLVPLLSARGKRMLGTLLPLAVMGSLVPYLTPALQNGDSAGYNEQVDTMNLGVRTTHFGYIALGVLFRVILPGPTDWVMNAMTLCVGGLGLLGVYFTALRLCREVVPSAVLVSALAAIALLGVPQYLRGSLLSEVDVPLAAFVAIAFSFMIHGKPVYAGLSYGFAVLISPLAVLALPAMLLAPTHLARGERRFSRWVRSVSIFAVFGLLVYVPVVALYSEDYFYGGRGLLTAPRKAFHLSTHAKRTLAFVEKTWQVLPFWAWGGCVLLWRGHWNVVLGGLATAGASLIFGERFVDVPVQLSAAALLAPWLAPGLNFRRRVPRILGVAVASAFVLYWHSELYETAQGYPAGRMAERERMMQIGASPGWPALLVNLRSYDQKRRFERMAFGVTYTNRALSVNEFRRWCPRLARRPARYAIWLMGRPFNVCKSLKKKYRMVTRNVGGKNYRVYQPRASARLR
jgi:hypothetical protein